MMLQAIRFGIILDGVDDGEHDIYFHQSNAQSILVFFVAFEE